MRYGKMARISGVLFMVSVIVLIGAGIAANLQILDCGSTNEPCPTTNTTSPPPAASNPYLTYSILVTMIVSICTATLSFLGFITTTFLAIKKERRDNQTATIDNEKKKLENEKLALEIKEIKSKTNKKKSSK